MSIAAGTRFGTYEVVEPIGAGGMGEVYRAHDTSLKRDVALKMLPESLLNDTSRLARLQREAEVLASLNHTNIAQIYGLERGESHTAIIMELIEGATLAERIEQGPIPADEALDIAMQIADALEVAHEQAIVHRDLKPANVKLRPDGTVKVLDFGIAKALDLKAASGPQPVALTTPAMTQAGLVLGTAAYMSPEQARGKPVDRRTDIWAFGCVLYEMLTGQPAFMGDDVTTTLARVLERDPDMRPLPAGLAEPVRHTLELCLEKDPRRRIADIRDVRLALQGVFGSAAASEGAPRQSLWRLAVPVAGALVVGAVLASVYWGSRLPAPGPEAPAPLRPITRFAITPVEAPLASLGGYDVVISPDGRRLAYFAENTEQGGVSLYVRDLDALEARRVAGVDVPNPAGGNMNPFFAPDGNTIGMFIPERGVVSVPVDGGPTSKMLDTPAGVFLGAAWTDDNTLIVSSGPILERVTAAGTSEPLTEPVGDGFVMSPEPLPGGRAVIYGKLSNGIESIEVLDLDTGEIRPLIENGQNATYVETGHIVFARGNTLMAAPFSVAELSLLSEPVAVMQGVRHPGPTTAADFSVSRSGTLVYVPAGAEAATQAAVVWVDRQGNVVERALPELVENPRDPRLSPDGTRLVLTTGALANGGVWSYDLRGRPPIPIAIGNIDYRLPIWSPDGAQISFVALGTTQTLIAPADGSALRPRLLERGRGRIAAAGEWGVPEFWSPDDDLIFQLSAASADIMVNTADGETRALVASEFSEFDAALSPNGRWLAYASNRTGQFEIWVRAYPEGAPIRISSTTGVEPHWSADGTELFYQLVAEGVMMAVAVETEGEFSFGTPVELFRGPYRSDFSSLSRSYDVGADGRFLMIRSEEAVDDGGTASSIVVVENWTEELARRVPVR